jgi:GR25 family glycosyltransferase involved in LPS biosynthesis
MYTKILLIIVLIIVVWKLLVIQKKEQFSSNFPNVFVINLAESRDRWAAISSQCKREGLNCRRHEAVNGKNLNIAQMKIVKNKKLSKGGIGCSLSHINLWNYQLSKKPNNSQHFIVLEDDCIIEKGFKDKFYEIMSEVPQDFDILYLGGSNLKGKKISKNIMVPEKQTKNSTRNTGTYAMVISNKCLGELINSNKIIDEYIDQSIKNKFFDNHKIYYCVPPLVKHNNEFDSMRRVLSGQSAKSWFVKHQDNIDVN